MRAKTSILKLIALVLILSVASHCKKINKGTELYVYTAAQHQGHLKLYMNQKDRGELPILQTSLSAKNDSILKKALHLSLKCGEYILEVRGENGACQFSAVLKIQSNSYQTSGSIGLIEHAFADGVLVSRISLN